MNKREEIVFAAARFFSEKGYFSTSVQEIAEDCKISKGTLYTYFSSKEELLIQVIDYGRLMLFQHSMNFNFDSFLSPKEKLIQKIVMQFDLIVENKSFIIMLFGTFIPANNSKIPELIHKVYVTAVNWYKDSLVDAYGDKIKPYLWDFTLILQGSIQEYIALAIKEDRKIDSEETVRFIVDCIETLIHHTKDVQPILTSDDMSGFDVWEKTQGLESSEELIDQMLTEAEKEIYRLPISKEERHEVISAIQYLRQEIGDKAPRRFIIQSLLLYLKDIERLTNLVNHLETILKSMDVSKTRIE